MDYCFRTSFSTSNGVQIFDISHPSNPSLIGSLHSGYVLDFALSSDGNSAYLVDYSSGLYIIDISDVSSPSVEAI